MNARPRYERKSIGWVLGRTDSCFVPVIERRIAAGQTARARVFPIAGRLFAQVEFADVALADLVVEVRR